jgi:hypothetical protein
MFPIPPTPTILARLRAKRSFSEGFLAIEIPNPVFACRVNQTFVTHDRVAEFIFDGVTLGAYTDVIPGMTAWIGSSLGAFDLGVTRVCKAATSDHLYVGETSEIAWSDNLFVTVVDQFGIHPKHIRIDAGVPKMDYDLAYSDQHNLFDPIPIMGSHRPVFLIADGIPTELDDDNVLITYSGFGVLSGGGRYGGSEHASNVTGEYYEYTFTGQRIQIIATKSSNYGKVAIYIDGILDTTIDQYSAAEVFQQIVYDKVLTNGTHTIKGIITGTKNIASAGYYGSLDAVIYETPAMLATLSFDASASWVFDSTIASYAWTAPGALSITDASTASPTVIYNTAGQRNIYCQLTATNGKVFMGVRRVFVFDDAHPPITSFSLTSCKADVDDGGWSFSVDMKTTQAATPQERALCILFARDYIDNSEESYGPVAGAENIIAMGWVGKNSIEYDANNGRVSFDVFGPQYWLKRISAFPSGLEFTSRTPNAWTQMKKLTVDRGIWHLLHWRTTCTQIMDFFPSLDTRYAKKLSFGSGTLWTQINAFAWSSIFARLTCNRYGQAFLETKAQLTPLADRTWGGFFLDKADIKAGIKIGVSQEGSTSMVNLSGIGFNAAGKGSAFFALSMGHVYTLYGAVEVVDKLLVADQAQTNSLAGLYMGWKNNPLGPISLELLRNNRFVDIAPRSLLPLTIDPADTPRGISFDGNTLVQHIDLNFEKGVFTSVLDLEAETFEQPSTNGDIPESEDEDISVPPPPPPPPPPPIIIVGCPSLVLAKEATLGLVACANFDDAAGEQIWFPVNGGLNPDFVAAIEKIFVTSYGKVYVGSMALQEIWSAETIGGTFTKLVDADWVNAYFGATGGHIATMGINPLGSDLIAFVANDVANSPKLFIGNNDGFSASPPLTNFSTAHPTWALTFGGGKWRETGWGGGLNARTWLFVFNADGSGQTDVDMDTYPLNPGTNGLGTTHIGAGASDRIYIAGSTYGGNLWMVTGNGTLVDTGVASPDSIGPGNTGWGFAVDETGANIMSNFGTVPNKSLDYGYSWSSMALLLPNGPYAFAWSGVVDGWLAAQNAIWYSADAGVTWLDKSGNLLDLIATPNITYIKAIGQ